MATRYFSATLNGISDITLPDGSTESWSADGYIDRLVLYDGSGDDFEVTVANENWGLGWAISTLEVASEGATFTSFQDSLGAGSMSIGELLVGNASSVSYGTVKVANIRGDAGGIHNVTNNGADSETVFLDGTTNYFSQFGGSVGLLRTGGTDVLNIHGGSAVSVQVGDGNDTVSVANDGSIDHLDTGAGNDGVTVENNGRIAAILDPGGNDVLTLNNAAEIDFVSLANGTNTVILNDTARIDVLRVLDGAVTINSPDDGYIGSFYGFNTRTYLYPGTNGVGQILLEGPGLGAHDIDADGHIGALQVKDGQTAYVTTGTGGADSIALSGGNDRVTASTGEVGTLRAGGGNDTIIYNSASGTLLDSGLGDDTVTLAHVGFLDTLVDPGGINSHTLRGTTTVGAVLLADSAETMTFQDSASALSLVHETGTLRLDSTGSTGAIGSIEGRAVDADLAFGSGGVGQVLLTPDGDVQSHTITADGYLGSLTVAGDQQTTLTTGAGGAGRIQLGDHDDIVETQLGMVAYIGGGDGNDGVLVGDGGAETVRLGKGDDTLTLGDRPDVQDLVARGGRGTDTLSFANATTGIEMTLDRVGLQNPGTPGGDLGAPSIGFIYEHGFENLTGTDFADLLWGDAGDNVLHGLGGNDVLNGAAGADTLDGGNDNDTLLGKGGTDTLFGSQGNDKLFGGTGADALDGGGGDDRLFGGGGNDVLAGGQGDDILKGQAGADVFAFGADGGTDHVIAYNERADTIQISDHDGGFGDLRIFNRGGDLRIAHDGGLIILDDLAGLKLHAGDFDFV